MGPRFLPWAFPLSGNFGTEVRIWQEQYPSASSIFENLDIWQNEKYREIQGSWSVIFLSFALIKEKIIGMRGLRLI